MLYHVSPLSGLKTLQPRQSSHFKTYVYAVDNLVTGLLFGASKDDFDLLLCSDEKETPIAYECCPNALETIYKGKGCSVYALSEQGFQQGMTGWAPEYVCEEAIPVQSESIVADIYDKIIT